MDGKPGRSEPSSGDGPPAADDAAASRAEPERYGPLTVTRLRKDDGRALLVFARASEDEL